MESDARRRLVRRVAAVLGLVWIVILLPALSPLYSGPEPLATDWRQAFLERASEMGLRVAALGTTAWAWWVGALDPQLGLWKPWKVESWIFDVFGWGGVLGAIVAAMLPPWAAWLLGRIVARRRVRPRTPPLSLRRAMRAAVMAGRRPVAWALLAALVLAGGHAGAVVDWWLGRPGTFPSLPSLLASASIGGICGFASVRLGLALIDGRGWHARELLRRPGRIIAYVVTTGALSVLVCIGLLLGIVPGVAMAIAFGFAPVVAAEDPSFPPRAFARSAALTRGARWPLFRFGVGCCAAAVALVVLVERAGASEVSRPVAVLIQHVVLAPLFLLIGCHLYRQLVASLPKTPAAERARRGWRRDPALAIAAAWSIALMVPFIWAIMDRVTHPNPAWLMLPPVRGDAADTTVPLSGWCPYSQHASASGCEFALSLTANQYGIDGYSFAGARCVPTTEVRQPSTRQRIVRHLEDALRRALGDHAVIRRSARLGAESLDLVIMALDESETARPILAVDVDDREAAELDRRHIARLAAAGLPEYWHVSEPRGPMPAMVTVWTEPIRAQRGYARQRAFGGTGDPTLKPIRLGEAHFAPSDLVPPACPAPALAASAPSPVCDGALAFVFDGSSPEPTLELTRLPGPTTPDVLRFAAVSTAPPSFDPRRDALSVDLHAAYPPTDLVHAVIPPGPRWIADAGGTTWTYDDPSGHSGGVTQVKITTVGREARRLAWKIEVRPERDSVPQAPVPDWDNVVVRVRLGPSPRIPDPCGEVFFAVGIAAGRCLVDDENETVRCSVSSAAPVCPAADLDGLVRCTVEDTARAQDVYFARRGMYFSGACTDLPGVTDRAGVVCTTMGTSTNFSVTALHGGMKHGCTLESGRRDEMAECS
ncbi:MAG TPA: hypothetical protein VEM57_02025 [Candidatus Binatus sp.]|nr:hypothetical protein [Candidatus Binatus sp.]